MEYLDNLLISALCCRSSLKISKCALADAQRKAPSTCVCILVPDSRSILTLSTLPFLLALIQDPFYI